MNKIRFFLKGVHTSFDLFFIFIIWGLVKKNISLEDELKELKDSSRQTHCTPYSYKKHPKSGPVPKEKPNYPIGFASAVDISKDDND